MFNKTYRTETHDRTIRFYENDKLVKITTTVPIGQLMSDEEIDSITLFKKQLTKPINIDDLPILPERNEDIIIRIKNDYYIQP